MFIVLDLLNSYFQPNSSAIIQLYPPFQLSSVSFVNVKIPLLQSRSLTENMTTQIGSWRGSDVLKKRGDVSVDKLTHMVGSYPPKLELQSYTTPAEEAPSGLVSRGSYTVHSLFTDDDKNTHLKWEWSFEIKKNWKD